MADEYGYEEGEGGSDDDDGMYERFWSEEDRAARRVWVDLAAELTARGYRAYVDMLPKGNRWRVIVEGKRPGSSV